MPKTDDDILWRGRPWIIPQVVGITILVIALGIAAMWLEIVLEDAFVPILGITVIFWTFIVLGVLWLILVLRYVIQRATERYTLRKIGMEVERGILSKRNIVLSTGGFSDMQVIRSITGRLLNVGDIIIRSEGEHDLRLKKIRKPVEIMGQIRDVMSRPLVKFTNGDKQDYRGGRPTSAGAS
jgi:uncharacterized membrane protein YdbT with pleckstrin-like domain